MAVRIVFAASFMAVVSVAVLAFGLELVLMRLWACVVAWCMFCSDMLLFRGSCSRVRAWAVTVHASGLVPSSVSAAVLRSVLLVKCCVKDCALFGWIVARRGRLCALYAYTGSVFPDVVLLTFDANVGSVRLRAMQWWSALRGPFIFAIALL